MKSLQDILIFEARKNRIGAVLLSEVHKVVMNLITNAVFMRFENNHYIYG